jgi:hypothetical protein
MGNDFEIQKAPIKTGGCFFEKNRHEICQAAAKFAKGLPQGPHLILKIPTTVLDLLELNNTARAIELYFAILEFHWAYFCVFVHSFLARQSF